LQKDIYAEYTQGAEDTILWGTNLNILLDVMQIINAVDVVVTVDTLIMHLAGAVGKTIFGMLGNKPDMRWPSEGYSPWYPTITFCRKQNEDWMSAFEQLPSWLKIPDNS
jgi:ADP-heptose:LPS heptosyltransferase